MVTKEYVESLIGKKVVLTFREGEKYIDRSGIDYREGIIDEVDIDEDFEEDGYYLAFKDFRCVNLKRIESIEVIE